MKPSLLLTTLLAATPIALLLPGCSGGTGLGSFFPTPQPTTTPVVVSQTSNFTLGNGQRAILKTTRNGSAITGTIQILAPAPNARTISALTRSIKIGTFSITGVFTPERSYNITVRDGNTVLFTQTGLFPTATQPGTYTLTFGNETDSGIIPVIGGPTATATPSPNPTTVPTTDPNVTPGLSVLRNLVLTPGSNFNGAGLGGQNTARAQTPSYQNTTKFVPTTALFPLAGTSTTRFQFEGQFVPNRAARVGDVITFTQSFSGNAFFYYYEAGNKSWQATGGTLRVTAVSARSVSFNLQNVTFALPNFGTSAATGTFTLNGSGVFSGN